MKFKYINVEGLGIILWPMTDHIFHKHIADACQLEEHHKILSAGFAEISKQYCYCYGESISLNKKSDPDYDTITLRDQLGWRQGYE